MVYPLRFCRFRKRTLGKASGFALARTVRSRQFRRHKKDTRDGVSFLVYPLRLELRIDGVGGRNVIQLHYEYVFSF